MATKRPAGAVGQISPSEGAFEITPSDTVDFDITTRGIFVGTSGDVKVDMVNGTTVTRKDMAGGIIHGMCCTRVYSTGTTATDLVGEY